MKSLQSLGTGRTLFLLLSLVLLLPIAGGTLRRVSAQSDDSGEDSLYKHLSVFTEVLSLIQRSYVDDTSLTQLFAGALDGTTDALDSMATYVPAPDVEDYRRTLDIGSSRSGLTVAREAGISFVVAVEKGSPGERAGVKAGDLVAKIDGNSTREMGLWELESLLARPGKTASLELLRHGQSKEIDLPLGEFESAPPEVRVEDGVPVLRVSSFTEPAVEVISNILSTGQAAGSGKLIVDVRGVAGGSVAAAYEVAGLFARGVLGELRSRGESVETFSSDAEPVWSGRLAILADGACQGPSEVFIAALKDAPDVDVVGARTFGHAGRLASHTMSTGAVLFYADAFYSAPDGSMIDRGLVPEVVVRATRQTLGSADGEAADPVLVRALELLQDEERQAA